MWLSSLFDFVAEFNFKLGTVLTCLSTDFRFCNLLKYVFAFIYLTILCYDVLYKYHKAAVW